RDVLENGNITHSVDYPDCNVGVKAGGERITILHRNVPNMIGQFTSVLAQENQNIALMTNKSKKVYAYT
ncbi:3-phosphoglycerate dehydrogenase, partial [Mediterraneibacter faecis]|nr:3-phosphoglycerate dehydrogenase [Mediterraneibacter faecis]